MKRRLGWLGPIIVLVGALAAAAGIWWMKTARSEAGKYLDVLALDGETALLVRGERASDRSFVELRHFDGAVAWQAMVPTYAGHPGTPGVAASKVAASVRVVRNGAAEVFGLSMRNASKLGGFKLASDRPRHPGGHTLPAAVTLTDLRHSFELAGQERSEKEGTSPWATLVAVDLDTGRGTWSVDLGAEPITSAGVTDGAVWVQQAGQVRGFRADDGVATTVAVTLPPPLDAPVRPLLVEGELRVEFDRKARLLLVHRGALEVMRKPWPANAIEPWPYHLAGGRLWVITPEAADSFLVTPQAAPDATTTTTPSSTTAPAAN